MRRAVAFLLAFLTACAAIGTYAVFAASPADLGAEAMSGVFTRLLGGELSVAELLSVMLVFTLVLLLGAFWVIRHLFRQFIDIMIKKDERHESERKALYSRQDTLVDRLLSDPYIRGRHASHE